MSEPDAEIQRALDERIDWIKGVIAAERKGGPLAVRDAVEDLDDDHVRSVLFVLLLNYAADAKYLRSLAAHEAAATLN